MAYDILENGKDPATMNIQSPQKLTSQYIPEMAKKYGVSVSQLANRFDLQLGTLPLPKSVHEEYIKENTELDFIISDDDMKALLAMTE